MSKFKVGDRVRVINYGHWIYTQKQDNETPLNILRENEHGWFHDIAPQQVGKEGVVAEERAGEYRLDIEGKAAWYSDEQLELVERGKQ